MNGRTFCWITAAVAVIATGWYHRSTQQRQAQLAAESQRLEEMAVVTQREADAARTESQAIANVLSADRATKTVSEISPTVSVAAPAQPPAMRVSPELRDLQVQAFVSEQQLRYAALLKRLGFDTQKLTDFDRIQGECQRTLLDESQTAAGRQQAREVRDTRLRELFGSDFEQWIEANRDAPARAVVTEIVRQTFQSSGVLTAAQANELTRIVAAHRNDPAKTTVPSQPRYDWEAIVADAGAVLDSRQRDDFAAAVRFRQVSDQMSALSSAKK